jgi:hypothetical protein
MIDPQILVDGFARNLSVIERQVFGLTHEDSLIQTEYHINCLNWVLGHIAVGRDGVLEYLGEQCELSQAELERYRRESDPITGDGPDVVRLERLMEILRAQQEKIADALGGLSAEDTARMLDFGGDPVSLARALDGQYFHEAYHAGQTDLLRQVAGMNDKVI